MNKIHIASAAQDYAAIDLGSNSFHMVVARYLSGEIKLLDRLKIMVRLASGLDEQNMLAEETLSSALEALERFGQRIREIPHDNVRAVGTSTFRHARNSNAFLPKFNAALGHPIEVIAGIEEARLIYQGVAHTIYEKNAQRLVIDIGGGSTELIIGEGFDVLLSESLDIGAASQSKRYFSDMEITGKRFRKARLACQQELETIKYLYSKTGWQHTIGTSGTILTIHAVIAAMGWSEQGITKDALEKLIDAMIDVGNSSQLKFTGLSESRKPVFCGGVAVLAAIFDTFMIDEMLVSDGALREGLIYDLIGRQNDKDIRNETVRHFMARYHVSVAHVERIEHTATGFFNEVQGAWRLKKKSDLQLLQWAARLHSIGISIAHSQYARHGAYLLEHSDMPGFSRQSQAELAILVLGQHRKLPKESIRATQDSTPLRLYRLCALLRLAILLHRSRTANPLPNINMQANDKKLDVILPEMWLDEHPLTRADLDQELGYWSGVKELALNYHSV